MNIQKIKLQAQTLENLGILLHNPHLLMLEKISIHSL